MKKILAIAVAAACLAITACGSADPSPTDYSDASYMSDDIQDVEAREVVDCDAGDRFEHDTDCGYTAAQHKARLAEIKRQKLNKVNGQYPAAALAAYKPSVKPAAKPAKRSAVAPAPAKTKTSTYSAPAPKPASTSRGGFGGGGRTATTSGSKKR
jgi:hypothetical protein